MPKSRGTALRAVLFTDVVGSTELARELGDERWTRLLAEQRRIVREELRSYQGREINTSGDGFFAVFEGPANAVRCAFACTRRVQELGLDIRAGVHVGEIELEGPDAHGIVVHTGARVMSKAGPAELLATQTMRDLVAGATIRMEERGVFELKGVPGTWPLFAVMSVEDKDRPSPVDPVEGVALRERAAAVGSVRARRKWLLVPLVAAVALIAVVAVSQLRRHPLQVPPAGTVAMIDGDRFDEPVKVGSAPVALTEDGGTIWVADSRSQVYWVKESDGSTGSRGVDSSPTGAASGGGAVWITGGFGSGNGPNGAVTRIDPASQQLVVAFDTPIGAQAVTFGAGAVWVASPDTGTVLRYDTISHATDSIALGRDGGQTQPDSISYADLNGGELWVGDSLAPRIYRISAGVTHEIQTYTVNGPVSAIAIGQDSIWAASAHADEIYAIDPATGSIRTTVHVASSGCNGPSALAVNATDVWVACSLSQRVIAIDPATGSVTSTLAVDGTPSALTRGGDGAIWVAVGPR